MSSINLEDFIDTIEGFPKQGISFKDIGPLLENPLALEEVKNRFCGYLKELTPDLIVGLDARGFLFSTLLANEVGVGSVMIRKAGKLPGDVFQESYCLEYGTAKLALQKSRNLDNKKVVIVDDLLAIGGTMHCAENLVTMAGGIVVGCFVVIELTFLKGASVVKGPVYSLVKYDE